MGSDEREMIELGGPSPARDEDLHGAARILTGAAGKKGAQCLVILEDPEDEEASVLVCEQDIGRERALAILESWAAIIRIQIEGDQGRETPESACPMVHDLSDYQRSVLRELIAFSSLMQTAVVHQAVLSHPRNPEFGLSLTLLQERLTGSPDGDLDRLRAALHRLEDLGLVDRERGYGGNPTIWIAISPASVQ